MSTTNGTKLDSKKILQELESLLIRHRAGMLSKRELREELAILTAIQKAYETISLEERICSLEDAIGGRNNGHKR